MYSALLAPPLKTTRSALSWFPANLAQISRRYEQLHPRDVLRWGLTTYGDNIVLATGFGPSGIVLIHMLTRMRPRTTIFYLETDLLFPETLALRDRLTARLGVQFTEVHSGLSLESQADQFGNQLWKQNPDLCCQLRKVDPLRGFLADKKAWITGIRRDQSVYRAFTEVIAWDKSDQVVKLNPLASWTGDQVWSYLHKHDLPFNPLHGQGYPSIGCVPCTRAVALGEDARAGRWAGTDKVECGIHLQPDDNERPA